MNNNVLKIKEWLLSQSPEIGEFDGDFNLVENGVFDSLQFLELINLIEDLSGQILDMTEITIADFQTLNVIENKFFN
jgi:acyl carrier protein